MSLLLQLLRPHSLAFRLSSSSSTTRGFHASAYGLLRRTATSGLRKSSVKEQVVPDLPTPGRPDLPSLIGFDKAGSLLRGVQEDERRGVYPGSGEEMQVDEDKEEEAEVKGTQTKGRSEKRDARNIKQGDAKLNLDDKDDTKMSEDGKENDEDEDNEEDEEDYGEDYEEDEDFEDDEDEGKEEEESEGHEGSVSSRRGRVSGDSPGKRLFLEQMRENDRVNEEQLEEFERVQREWKRKRNMDKRLLQSVCGTTPLNFSPHSSVP